MRRRPRIPTWPIDFQRLARGKRGSTADEGREVVGAPSEPSGIQAVLQVTRSTSRRSTCTGVHVAWMWMRISSLALFFFEAAAYRLNDAAPVKPGTRRQTGQGSRSPQAGILRSSRQEGKPHGNLPLSPCFAVPDTVRFFSKMGSRKLVRLADAKEGKSSERWLEAEDQQGPLSQNRHRRSTLACLLHPTPDEARGG